MQLFGRHLCQRALSTTGSQIFCQSRQFGIPMTTGLAYRAGTDRIPAELCHTTEHLIIVQVRCLTCPRLNGKRNFELLCEGLQLVGIARGVRRFANKVAAMQLC